MSNQEQTRFRSFVERFLVERASAFDKNNVDKDVWEALMQAKTAYSQIALISESMYPDAKPGGASTQAVGATGAVHSWPVQSQQVTDKIELRPDLSMAAKVRERMSKGKYPWDSGL